MSQFFDSQKIDGDNIFEIYLKNSQLPSSDYKKMIISAHDKYLCFTGDYPESTDYIFYINSEIVILNSTRVPVQNNYYGNNFIIQTSEYHFDNFMNQKSLKITAHADFYNQRIKIFAHSTASIFISEISPNMDVFYDILEGNFYDIYMTIDDR